MFGVAEHQYEAALTQQREPIHSLDRFLDQCTYQSEQLFAIPAYSGKGESACCIVTLALSQHCESAF